MYQEQRTVFYYCMSPVHMGAGTAVGAIDNPVQREVHTGHPCFAGSGIKGAVRHFCTDAWRGNGDLNAVFGPDTSASDYAGAVTFTDAQLVAFPVRTLKETFAYATCPTALARLKRCARDTTWSVPSVTRGKFLGDSSNRLVIDGKLILEAFEYDREAPNTDITAIAGWIAENCLPNKGEFEYFRNKLRSDLVVLNDTDFAHFVQHSTIVEPHVRINNDTGTADDGGLFYTENLPPESLLAGQILATVERRRADRGADDAGAALPRTAGQMLKILLAGSTDAPGIDGKTIQVGGDATTGRGLVTLQTFPRTGEN